VTESRSLHGRRALVTGAATGIGRATAKRLAQEGATVVVNHIAGDPAGEAVGEIREAGGQAIAIEADVSRENQVAGLFEQASRELGGPVNLLVNNAGVEAPFDLQDMPLEEWNRVLSINLTGPFLCSREMVRGLLAAKEPGTIVNVSSVHEVIPWPKFSHYCASKGGLKLFSQSIARELAPHRIRVALVAPGAVLTPINQDLIDHPEMRSEVEEQIPWGRFGEPEEIAAAIAWLAGPEADYVVGATLFVDGGMTLYPKWV
jgi:glucose 1-dehydrogenase